MIFETGRISPRIDHGVVVQGLKTRGESADRDAAGGVADIRGTRGE
jgi:hypothetical protein